MATIEKAIDVEVPVKTVYNQWTQFEQFPRFMEGVERVQQLDESHLHWVGNVGGKRREWDAEIVEQMPDERITWVSRGGEMNGGEVSFYKLDNFHTRVLLHMEYEPEGLVENVGSALGFADRKVEGDLKRFKDFIEARGHETGAWRGSIHQN